MILIVKKIFSLLNDNQKKQTIFFLILLFFSTIFEGLSVALVFPLIKGVIDKDFFQNVESKFSFLELSNQISFIILLFPILILPPLFYFLIQLNKSKESTDFSKLSLYLKLVFLGAGIWIYLKLLL